MLMENLEKTTKSKRKTPPLTISGYTDSEMEQLYTQAKSKIGEKPPTENLNEPKMDFKVADRAVQHSGTGKTVKIDPSRDSLLTDFGRETLEDRYLMKGESFQELFAELLHIMVMMMNTLKDYTIIFHNCGLCLQHQFFRTEEIKGDYLFHVFSMKQMIV